MAARFHISIALTIEIVPDQNAELLRLEAGQIDTTANEIAPESYAPLKRAADAGRIRLFDLGVGLDAPWLWFNLKPGAFGGDPRASWLQRDELRQAISLAVDRQLVADTVYLGAAVPVYGPITPSNKKWYWDGLPKTPHDPAAARVRLAAIGLTDRNGDGMLEDAGNRPAQFTLLTQKGRPDLERACAVIRDEMRKVGVVVDVVTLEANALVDRFANTGKYEAVYFTAIATDTDPALNPDFWFSFGSAHLWNMAQKTPATEWERRIDELMAKQIASPDEAERKRLFDEVQQMFSEHEPVSISPRRGCSSPCRRASRMSCRRSRDRRRCGSRTRWRSNRRPNARVLFAPSDVRAVPGVRRVVGVARPRAAGGRRLRHRITRHRGATGDDRAGARALRPRQVDCRAVRRLAGPRRAAGFRTLAALRPSGQRSHSRTCRQHRAARA